MSHYGYVSEQLLNGELLPPRRGRHKRDRRSWSLWRRTAGSRTRPELVEPAQGTPAPRPRKVGVLAQVVPGRH